jgi:hypothetical protein
LLSNIAITALYSVLFISSSWSVMNIMQCRCGLGDNITMDLKEIWCKQDPTSPRWRVHLTVINIRVP